MLRVLHIEDEANIRITVHTALAGEAVVKWAPCLDSAQRRLAEEAFDVVLLDLNLVGSQGLDTLRVFRGFCKLPVVVLSAVADPSVLAGAAALGAEDYIIKDTMLATKLVSRLRFAHGRHQTRHAPRRRIAESAFESLKPYITCGSQPPFAAA